LKKVLYTVVGYIWKCIDYKKQTSMLIAQYMVEVFS